MLLHLSFFSSRFPYSSPPLLIFSFENRPAAFPGRMTLKATKPSYYRLTSEHKLSAGKETLQVLAMYGNPLCSQMHAFIVWFCFFPYQAKRLSPKQHFCQT